MDILGTLLASARGGSLSRAAETRGIDGDGVSSLLQQLVPALTASIKRNASSEDGLSDLTSALRRGDHRRYLDNAGGLTTQAAVEDGNGILGHVLGSKDASRNLAARAAERTGIDVGLVKKLLPLVAATTMGAMSKGMDAGESGVGGMLGALLDTDGDGNVVDDLLSFGKKFL